MLSELRKPSPALVLAFIALFAAVGGGAYAAKVAKKNSVATKSIKKGAVKSSKIGDGAVATAKLADGGVTTAKLADGAVNSAKLLDNDVKGVDVDETSFAGQCPAGTKFVIETCLELADRTAALYPAARADCVDEGRVIPDIQVLAAAATSADFPTLNDEWSGELAAAATPINVLSDGTFIEDAGIAHKYRCQVALLR